MERETPNIPHTDSAQHDEATGGPDPERLLANELDARLSDAPRGQPHQVVDEDTGEHHLTVVRKAEGHYSITEHGGDNAAGASVWVDSERGRVDEMVPHDELPYAYRQTGAPRHEVAERVLGSLERGTMRRARRLARWLGRLGIY